MIAFTVTRLSTLHKHPDRRLILADDRLAANDWVRDNREQWVLDVYFDDDQVIDNRQGDPTFWDNPDSLQGERAPW